jgi:hypothetical protein
MIWQPNPQAWPLNARQAQAGRFDPDIRIFPYRIKLLLQFYCLDGFVLSLKRSHESVKPPAVFWKPPKPSKKGTCAICVMDTAPLAAKMRMEKTAILHSFAIWDLLLKIPIADSPITRDRAGLLS